MTIQHVSHTISGTESPTDVWIAMVRKNQGAILTALIENFDNNKWILEELTSEQLCPSPCTEKIVYDIILDLEKSGREISATTILAHIAAESSANMTEAKSHFKLWRSESGHNCDLRAAVDVVKNNHKKCKIRTVLRTALADLDEHQREAVFVSSKAVADLDRLAGTVEVPSVSQTELNKATLLSLTEEPAPIFSTGFHELDKRIGGLSPSRTYLVAARTGVGKSAFLLNLANWLGKQRVPWGFISLEMNREAMNKRLFGIVGGLDAAQLKYPLDNSTMDKVRNIIKETDQWTSFWSDKRGLTLSDLKTTLSQFSRRGCKVAFIDYIQRVVVPGNEPRHIQVGAVAKTIADLAERLNMAIVVASQLNREGAKADTPPELHHISESTVIEESADVIILLNNKKKEDVTSGRNRPMRANVAKNRHGSGGYFDMYYRGRQFKFSDRPFESDVRRQFSVPSPQLDYSSTIGLPKTPEMNGTQSPLST